MRLRKSRRRQRALTKHQEDRLLSLVGYVDHYIRLERREDINRRAMARELRRAVRILEGKA